MLPLQALTSEEQKRLLQLLQKRFEQNSHRHQGIQWENIVTKLEQQPLKLQSLQAMEDTGGEPDVVGYDEVTNEYLFYDCSTESPKGRRSWCYDAKALDERKDFKPENSAVAAAEAMGITLLNESEYRYLQQFGPFDIKTSSWLLTPVPIRALGGALFGDYRYKTVFVYHNGASSYYAARGFRGCLRV